MDKQLFTIEYIKEFLKQYSLNWTGEIFETKESDRQAKPEDFKKDCEVGLKILENNRVYYLFSEITNDCFKVINEGEFNGDFSNAWQVFLENKCEDIVERLF